MSSSQRQILHATSIVAVASVLNIAIGLIRTKIAALLLGPSGIGEIGLFFNLVQFAATLGAVGLGTSAVRQIAEARGRDDATAIAAARSALVWTSLVLAVASGILFWVCGDLVGRYLAVDPRFAGSFGWLALAVVLTILSGVPVALLIGHRRVGEQAMVQIIGALVGTIAGISILLLWRDAGIVGYTVSSPAAMLLAGLVIARRLPKTDQAPHRRHVWTQSRAMVILGFPLMAGAISVTGGMLALRSLLAHRMGSVALGQFTAAWTLCVTYVGFVLQAMASDYFPRLSATIADREEAKRVVNEQIETTLLIALPIILFVQASAPWLIRLLYSGAFAAALEIVRWQMLGDVLKVAAAPLAYIILAQGRGRVFWLTETSAIVMLVGSTVVLLPWFGLRASGVGQLIAMGVYLPLVYTIARRLIGFSASHRVLVLLASAFALTALVAAVGTWWAAAGLVLGVILTIATGLHTVRTLDLVAALPETLRRYLPTRFVRWIGSPAV